MDKPINTIPNSLNSEQNKDDKNASKNNTLKPIFEDLENPNIYINHINELKGKSTENINQDINSFPIEVLPIFWTAE